MVNCIVFPFTAPCADHVASVELRSTQLPETVPVKLFSEFALASQSMGQAPFPIHSVMEPDTADPACELTSSSATSGQLLVHVHRSRTLLGVPPVVHELDPPSPPQPDTNNVPIAITAIAALDAVLKVPSFRIWRAPSPAKADPAATIAGAVRKPCAPRAAAERGVVGGAGEAAKRQYQRKPSPCTHRLPLDAPRWRRARGGARQHDQQLCRSLYVTRSDAGIRKSQLLSPPGGDAAQPK